MEKFNSFTLNRRLTYESSEKSISFDLTITVSERKLETTLHLKVYGSPSVTTLCLLTPRTY